MRRHKSGKQAYVKGKKDTGESSTPKVLQKLKPPTLDWCNRGMIKSGVKNQGNAFTCWAMSVAPTLEACVNINLHLSGEARVEASIQELIDWVPVEVDAKGKKLPLQRMLKAWEHIKKCGLSLVEEYQCDDKYKENPMPLAIGEQLPAKGIDENRRILVVQGYTDEVHGDMDFSKVSIKTKKVKDVDILEALKRHPVVAVIVAYNSFNSWLGDGIYQGPTEEEISCDGKKPICHAVLLVGYGTEEVNEEQVDYFYIRNSYGNRWGYNGFGRIMRNRPNGRSAFISYSYPAEAAIHYPEAIE